MRLLLDTHYVIAAADGVINPRFSDIRSILDEAPGRHVYSVASLWEIAIKMRLGKFSPRLPLIDIPPFLKASGLGLLGIDVAHVFHPIEPEPPTRDPFDRLLLAQCHVEGLRLVTVDRALVDHPLAFRP
ncbi:MAG: type II toxin-antitoxin system VapC family toxin [Agrobacterium albertimagni]